MIILARGIKFRIAYEFVEYESSVQEPPHWEAACYLRGTETRDL